MLQSLAIALVDPDARRRARISYAAAGVGLHIEPFENAVEIQVLGGKRAILVHDDGETIEQALGWLARIGCWLPIVAYRAEPTACRVAESIHAGALDYLAWPFTSDELGASLARVQERAHVVGKRRADVARAKIRLEHLSTRESEVIAALVEGLTNKAIAQRLQISPRTVEIHRSNAIGKLGVGSSSEAVLLAFTAAQAVR